MKAPRWTWLLPLGIALLSLSVSAYASYTHDRQDALVAIAVSSNQLKNDHERLERIERKQDEQAVTLNKMLEMLITTSARTASGNR